MTGNNAEEGMIFTPQNITTRVLLVEYLKRYFPRLSDDQVARVLEVYNTPDTPDDPSKARYWTADIPVYIPQPSEPIDLALQDAFQRAWGSFITANKPSDWPRRTALDPLMQNVNLTGGTPVDTKFDETLTVKKLEGPGIVPEFTEVNAETWEGGRGARCRFLRSLAESLVI
ncbi:hypothetical protein SLS56_008317 [Neofusicoccum ribis]|uniref:Uncharacterized protein n=1 Tax=Neofusicoccum ribis TaxID=45134 RepID=A0ABR3SLA3_9PEZI